MLRKKLVVWLTVVIPGIPIAYALTCEEAVRLMQSRGRSQVEAFSPLIDAYIAEANRVLTDDTALNQILADVERRIMSLDVDRYDKLKSTPSLKPSDHQQISTQLKAMLLAIDSQLTDSFINEQVSLYIKDFILQDQTALARNRVPLARKASQLLIYVSPEYRIRYKGRKILHSWQGDYAEAHYRKTLLTAAVLKSILESDRFLKQVRLVSRSLDGVEYYQKDVEQNYLGTSALLEGVNSIHAAVGMLTFSEVSGFDVNQLMAQVGRYPGQRVGLANTFASVLPQGYLVPEFARGVFPQNMLIAHNGKLSFSPSFSAFMNGWRQKDLQHNSANVPFVGYGCPFARFFGQKTSKLQELIDLYVQVYRLVP